MGVWPQLPGAKKLSLVIDGQKAIGTLKLASKESSDAQLSIQGVFINRQGKTVTSMVRPLRSAKSDSPGLPLDRATSGTPQAREDPRNPQARAVATIELEKIELPEPTSPNTALEPNVRTQDGLTVTNLNRLSGELVNDLIWSANGEAFFALTSNGVLRRVAKKGWIVERQIDLEHPCSSLAISATGLLIALPNLQQVWVIDPDTLAVKKRIGSPGAYRVLSGPTLNFALTASKPTQGFPPRDVVVYVDLQKGQATFEYKAPVQHANLTPDGKYYFAQSGIEELWGFRVKDKSLNMESKSDRIAQNGQCICVSPDSKMVCLPSGGGNYNAGSSYSTLVYQVDSLSRPVLTLESGAYPRLVGFDPKGKLVFAQNFEHPLIVYSITGNLLGKYKLGTAQGQSDARQFVAHPDGKKLLVLTQRELLFVEIDK